VADRDYIFANAQYDLGWCRASGVEIKGRINDICIADTLIDEEQPDGYSLDAMCRRWGFPGKDEELLRDASINWGLTNAKADLWKLPAKLVGPYGEADPVRTLAIWQKQKQGLRAQSLWSAFELERKVTRVLFEMFWQGVRVDVAYAQELNARWLKEENALYASLHMSADDIWNTDYIARLCDKEGISYPRTKPTKNFPNGQPSITKGFMEASKHPALLQLQKLRAIQRTRSVYLEQNLIKNVLNGRIHPQYIQMNSEDGGTRSMRLSCRNPNAQQFPKRSTLFDAKSLRKSLIPEDGMLWGKQDYWSQEPIIQCHYALLEQMPGAKEAAEQFKKGIKLATYVEKATNGELNYDQAKQVILARSYNQQPKGMSETTGMPIAQCESIIRRLRPARALHQAPLRQGVRQGPKDRRHQAPRRAPAPLQLLGGAVLRATARLARREPLSQGPLEPAHHREGAEGLDRIAA
jgi:DNA polymerase I-like protein with 3'-5' exonuclease and polymerase domains